MKTEIQIYGRRAARLADLVNVGHKARGDYATVRFTVVWGQATGPEGRGWWAFPFGRRPSFLGRNFQEALNGLLEERD